MTTPHGDIAIDPCTSPYRVTTPPRTPHGDPGCAFRRHPTRLSFAKLHCTDFRVSELHPTTALFPEVSYVLIM